MKTTASDTYVGHSLMSLLALVVGACWGGAVWLGWVGLNTASDLQAFIGFWVLAVPLWLWWGIATLRRALQRRAAPPSPVDPPFLPPTWLQHQPLPRWKYLAGWANVPLLSCLFFLNNYLHGCDGPAREVTVAQLEQAIDQQSPLPGRHLSFPLAGQRLRCDTLVTTKALGGQVVDDDYYCLVRSQGANGGARIVLLLNQLPPVERDRLRKARLPVQGVVRDVLWEGLDQEELRLLGAHRRAILVEVGLSPKKLLANGFLVPGLVGLVSLLLALYSHRAEQRARRGLPAKEADPSQGA